MSNPFMLDGPTLISFSGGRTSAFMLRRILDAYDGALPPDTHVTFANTGKERPETLRFVHDCATQWHVSIRWLEYRRTYLPKYKSDVARAAASRSRAVTGRVAEPLPNGVVEPGYTEVSFETASRNGEPFQNYIDMSGVPNAAGRRCTTELKIRPMKRFMLDAGYDSWTNVVGIRADEPDRVRRMRVTPPERWENQLPLADAGVTEEDVMAFWGEQPFDLALHRDPDLGTYEGNCDLCLMKSTEKKVRIARENPSLLSWWEDQERNTGSFFRRDMTYARVRLLVIQDGHMPTDDDLGDCICHD